MLDSIDDRRVKNFIDKNDDDPYFPKWQDLPWSQQIIFILKEIVNENLNLKHQIRDLKGVKILEAEEPIEEKEEPIEEIEEEPFKLDEVSTYEQEYMEPQEQLDIIPEKELDEIIEPIKEDVKIPIEISEFACPICEKKLPNKGLLASHINKHQKEDNDV